MIKTIKRWFETIKWLLNHPPTSFVNTEDILTCDYCGSNVNVWRFDGVFSICFDCMKRTFDKNLSRKDVEERMSRGIKVGEWSGQLKDLK